MSLFTEEKNLQREVTASIDSGVTSQEAHPKTEKTESEAQLTKRVEVEPQPLIELRRSEAIYEEAKKILPAGA
ncbi:MAG: hypothetical protein ABSA81_04255, partial [Candidatus Bathyarchaeia archaeon]